MSNVLWGARIDGETYGREGDAPWDVGTWSLFEGSASKSVSLVAFGQPWCKLDATAMTKCWSRQVVPLVSMSDNGTPLKAIADGKYDSEIIEFAHKAKEYRRPFLLRWLWEMNGTWYAYGRDAKVDPSLYVAAWHHFFGTLKLIGADNVTSVWCPNVVFPGSTPLKKLYPGNSWVDWVGLDGYNWAGLKTGVPWKSFGEVFAPSYLEIGKITSKPVMICEVGCTEKGGNKAEWINDMFARLPDYSRIRGLSWFNWNNVENGVRNDWPIESSQKSKFAFAVGIKNDRYLSVAVEPPALTKIGVPR